MAISPKTIKNTTKSTKNNIEDSVKKINNNLINNNLYNNKNNNAINNNVKSSYKQDNAGLNNYADNKYQLENSSQNSGTEINPLSNYSNNIGQNTTRDVTSSNPASNDLGFYNKLSSLKDQNNLLIEKYGLQNEYNQAQQEMAQQDVLRQQQNKALNEQLRATGMNNGGVSETMNANVLNNYSRNIKDIQNNYNDTVSAKIENTQLDNYNEVKDTIDNLLTTNNYDEIKKSINNADITDTQRNSLLNYLDTANSYINGEDITLPIGVNKNEDGTYQYGDYTIQPELENIVNDSEILSQVIDSLNTLQETMQNELNNTELNLKKDKKFNLETYRNQFIEENLSGLPTNEKEYYTKYFNDLFDQMAQKLDTAKGIEYDTKNNTATFYDNGAKVNAELGNKLSSNAIKILENGINSGTTQKTSNADWNYYKLNDNLAKAIVYMNGSNEPSIIYYFKVGKNWYASKNVYNDNYSNNLSMYDVNH